MKSILKSGFTLIELSIVIVISGILASIAIPLYRGAINDAKWVEGITLMHSIKNAIDVITARNSACNDTLDKHEDVYFSIESPKYEDSVATLGRAGRLQMQLKELGISHIIGQYFNYKNVYIYHYTYRNGTEYWYAYCWADFDKDKRYGYYMVFYNRGKWTIYNWINWD